MQIRRKRDVKEALGVHFQHLKALKQQHEEDSIKSLESISHGAKKRRGYCTSRRSFWGGFTNRFILTH